MKFFRSKTEVKDARNWQKKPVEVEVGKSFDQLQAVLIDFSAEFESSDHHMGKIAIEVTEPKMDERDNKYFAVYEVSVLLRDKSHDNDYAFTVNTLLMASNS